jgi:hypothetical protein
MRLPNSGRIRKMYLDKQANVWELISRVHTDNYCYCTIRNVITEQQITITDWALQRRYFTL